MNKYEMVKLFKHISINKILNRNYGKGCLVRKGSLRFSENIRLYTEGPGKKPPKEEQIESVKMPGFVHPQIMHEEGYFTQKAKQQIEELKKRVDKPTIENTEKKEQEKKYLVIMEFFCNETYELDENVQLVCFNIYQEYNK